MWPNCFPPQTTLPLFTRRKNVPVYLYLLYSSDALGDTLLFYKTGFISLQGWLIMQNIYVHLCTAQCLSTVGCLPRLMRTTAFVCSACRLKGGQEIKGCWETFIPLQRPLQWSHLLSIAWRSKELLLVKGSSGVAGFIAVMKVTGIWEGKGEGLKGSVQE